MARTDWYRLDNVGKFYSAQAGSNTQTVFRFSATMSESVDPAVLQQALERTIKNFPGFNVSLRSGLFWHYLEPSQAPLKVQPETLAICFGLHADLTSVLFRVTFYDCRINVEVSHMISDGRGTLEFFKMLLYAYLEARYSIPDLVPLTTSTPLECTEDSYTANFERKKAGAGSSVRPYRIAGWKDAADPTYIEYHLSADKVHTLAKRMGVSVTTLIIAAVACAVRDTMPRNERDRAIQMDIPVDLRQLFGSATLRNFFGLAFVSYTPHHTDAPLAEVAKDIQKQLTDAVEPDALKRRMNRMIKLEKNPLLRIAPLFLKDAVLKLAASLSARDITTTISSIGRIEMDQRTYPFIKNINVLTSTQGINFVACTFKDTLSIGISSIFVSQEIVRNFCRIFANEGIEGTINLNKDQQQIHELIKQSHLEESLKHIGANWKEGKSR